MIELVMDNEVVKINSDLTIGQYQVLQSKGQFYQDNPHQLISLFTGIPFNDVKNMSMENVRLVQGYLNNAMLNTNKDELVMTFEYEGVEYGLETEFGKMAFGAWIDFEVYTSQDIVGNIHNIMSILYRPIKSKDKKGKYTILPYNSNDIEERGLLFRDLPVKYWLGVATFFFQVANLYISNIKASLESKRKTNEMITKGWKKLPKFLQKRLPLDTILLSYSTSQTKMSQKLSK